MAHYRVREFAGLGGVTVKALLHYDKLGLLTPARTPAGHRVYSDADLDRLRRILALKRVGVPLARMRALLNAAPPALVAQLTADRDVIAQDRERLRLADRALGLVEESLRHAPDDTSGLRRLADVIDLQHDASAMKRYFSDAAWEVAKGFYQDWPGEAWVALCRDIVAAIPAGPAGAGAEKLWYRWNALALSLWGEFTSDAGLSRQLHEGFARAWRDREHWPDPIARRFADYRLNDIMAFLRDVSLVAFSSAIARESPRRTPAGRPNPSRS